MTQEQKEKIAVFRFGVIFPLVECHTRKYWGEKERILRELVEREWEIPFSNRTFISRATILNWLTRYRSGGEVIETLLPANRNDRGIQRALDGETVDVLVRMRKENPKLSVPRLVEKAVALGLFPPGKEVSMATV